MDELSEALESNAYLFVLGGGLFALGTFLLFDDIADFGEYSYKAYPHSVHDHDHPLPLHHWQYGVILIILALIVFTYAGMRVWAYLAG